MRQTVIFDLDGTLLDTLDDLTCAVNYALERNGLPRRTKPEIRSFVGNGAYTLIQRSIGERNVDVHSVFLQFKDYYKGHCNDYTKVYEEVIPLLKTLKEKGIQTCIVSNKPDAQVKQLTDLYFKEFISLALGENEEQGLKKKPAPDGLLFAMQAVGANPKSTLYVGDSEVDIQTAKNANLPCVSVTWGFKDKEFLIKNGGEIFIDTPNQLLTLLKE